MSTHNHQDFHSCCKPPKKWHEKKVWWAVGAIFLAGMVSNLFPLLRPFSLAFREYFQFVAWAVGVGLVIGGIMDHYVPKEYISKILAGPRKRTIFYATGLGLLASACSHGILALSMELHKKGASGPAVVSFLLASPWANFPVTLLLVGLFGWKGILIISAALFVALSTGLIFQWLDQKGWIEKNRHTADFSSSIWADLKGRFKDYRFTFPQFKADLKGIARGTIGLSEMVLGWVMLGVTLASLAQAYIPGHLFHAYLGPTPGGLLLTLIAATILEVCSEGTAPLAFEIYRQTRALGNSFVFLSAGVITDYTEIGLVWSNLGKRTALWMIGVGVPQILILGYLFNRFF